MQPVVANVAWSVCVCACLLDTNVSHTKTPETANNRGDVWHMDLDGTREPWSSPDPQGGGAVLGDICHISHPIVRSRAYPASVKVG